MGSRTRGHEAKVGERWACCVCAEGEARAERGQVGPLGVTGTSAWTDRGTSPPMVGGTAET